jgi:2-keto-4-pentenoate hydratase
METNKFQQNTALSPSLFVNDTTAVEGEFAFWIGKDLPGPDVTREQVIDAISAVGGVVELLSSWTRGPKGMETTHTHDITGNVFHVGVILGEKRVKLKDIDFTQEIVTAEINGAAKATASGTTLMGKDPTLDQLKAAIRRATIARDFAPLFTGSAFKNRSAVIMQRVYSRASSSGRLTNIVLCRADEPKCRERKRPSFSSTTSIGPYSSTSRWTT